MWWLLACLAAAGLIFWWVKLGRPRRASARPLPVSAPASEAQPRSSVAARARSAKEPARWIAPGEAVSIGGITITSGMIYVGGAASTAMHGDPDNCVVDPRLPLGENVDRPGGAMPPWPSYGGIQPRERRTYLEWLAGGRCDPEIGIGYVFLFFYGLERRYFIEGARQEHRALADEVRRLLEIHGRHGAFRGHARRFLDALDVLHATDQHPALSPQPAAGYDISLLARRRLGRKLAHGEPLAAGDALTWHLALPDTRLRPSIARCFDAFVALWTLGFAERYPAGLKVSAPPIPLKLSYRAASGAFGGEVDILVDGAPVPDIAAVRASLGGLRDLADACTEALEPYARLLARNPALRDTPEAVVLLPPELAGPDRNAVVGAMRDRLGVMLNGHKVAQLGVAELFDILALPVPGHGVLGSAQRSQISTLLDLLDIGFEPDPRYGSGAPVGEGRVLLFRAEGGAPVEWEKPAYRSAKCMCEVVVLAAPAGGPPPARPMRRSARSCGTSAAWIPRSACVSLSISAFFSPMRRAGRRRGANCPACRKTCGCRWPVRRPARFCRMGKRQSRGKCSSGRSTRRCTCRSAHPPTRMPASPLRKTRHRTVRPWPAPPRRAPAGATIRRPPRATARMPWRCRSCSPGCSLRRRSRPGHPVHPIPAATARRRMPGSTVGTASS
ncbi:TerB N-terminal domain-containing protein [Xanthobacter dioxanivorans]|uniref:TerB N-terminal domain-containing protein n=1 Tax=Xanthobacter dioxanivorans TaxID=2528964 RepID=A0A974SGV1_9HYPH|nr:TerB N-terminal domain-containing protein [Xanthobacter dioxanivorans]